MTDEERLNNEAKEQKEDTPANEYQEYIDTINELKKNSVSKEKYDQLKAEKQGLIEALKTGGQVKIEEEKEKVDIDQLRKDLYGNPNKQMSDIEYIDKTLQLRDALIEKGERDPFLPNGADYNYSKEDQEKADYIASVYRECLEYANGDNQAFINELARRTKDDSPIMGRKFKN